jgi:hypothetical protein
MKTQTVAAAPPITDEEIDRVRRETIRRDQVEPRVAKASYDCQTRHLVLQMRDGVYVSFPARRLPSLKRASDDQLAAVRVRENGASLHWDELDVQSSTLALLQIIFRFRTVSDHARRAGSTPSLKKARAARENGRKGGRPKMKV